MDRSFFCGYGGGALEISGKAVKLSGYAKNVPESVRMRAMLCQICKKNPATVHVQEIVNGEKRIMHFCAECAEKKSMLEPFLKGMTLAGLLQKITEMEKEGAEGPEKTEHQGGGETGESRENQKEPEEMVCPECSWSLEQLKKTGRMGCPSCYTVFLPLLRKELAGIHRGHHYCGRDPERETAGRRGAASGKAPESAARMRERIATLKKDMEESIRREEYELAADLRDRIGALERSLSEKERD